MKNNNHSHHYNGYLVSPSAYQLSDGWFASNLLLERGDAAQMAPAAYTFHALDYFDTELQALGHANAWARDWIDNRG